MWACLLLVTAAPSVEITQESFPAPVAVTQPTGARGARPLGQGYALSVKGVGSTANTPLGMIGLDVGGALAVASYLDIFGGARIAVGFDATRNTQTSAVPYVGARVGGSMNGRTFFGFELSVSAPILLPKPNNVTWVIEPAALVSFTPRSGLELIAGVYGLSAPQLGMWGVGPGFGSALRVAPHWSLLIEVKTLILGTPTNTTLAPTLAFGGSFQ